jgi:hypothetical protein
MAVRVDRQVKAQTQEVPEARTIWGRALARQALVMVAEATVPLEEVAAEQEVCRHMGVTVGMAALERSGTQLTAQEAVAEEVQAVQQRAPVVRAVFMAAARVVLAMTMPAAEPQAVRASSCSHTRPSRPKASMSACRR